MAPQLEGERCCPTSQTPGGATADRAYTPLFGVGRERGDLPVTWAPTPQAPRRFPQTAWFPEPPDPPEREHRVGWFPRLRRQFDLDIVPDLGMAAGGRLLTDVEFSVIPDLGMSAAPRSGAAFSLDVIPDLGMVLPGPIPAEFDMAVIPDLGVEAGESYTRDFTIDAPADMGMVASERYTRSFELAVIPDIGADATMRRSGAFTLDAVPDLGMVGVERPAAVTYNATGAGSVSIGNGTRVFSWTHTASGDNRAVIAAVAGLTTLVNITDITVTYGGTPMTPLAHRAFNNSGTSTRTAIFGLLNPPTGAQTVTATVTLSSGVIPGVGTGNSVSYNGVASIGPATAAHGSGNRSQTVTAAAGEMIVQAFGGASGHTGYNRTQRAYHATGTAVDAALVVGDAEGSPSVVFTANGSGAWSGVAARLQP